MRGSCLPRLLIAVLALAAVGGVAQAATKTHAPANLDVRVLQPEKTQALLKVHLGDAGAARAAERSRAEAANRVQGLIALRARVTGAEARLDTSTGGVELLRSSAHPLTPPSGASARDIALGFMRDNPALFALSASEIAALRFKGESLSPKSGLRMARFEEMANGLPVFGSDTRFLIDRRGSLVKVVGGLPYGSSGAPAASPALTPQAALVNAMQSVGIPLNVAKVSVTTLDAAAGKFRVTTTQNAVSGAVDTRLVYFPLAPRVFVLAWQQVSFTRGAGDYTTVVDATTGDVLWRKNIRATASTQQARFSVYVQADNKTPADSPAPQSPSLVTPGSGTQFPEIARTTVSMLTVQDLTASPNGWITDGGNTTTGDNVDAYLDTDDDDAPDAGLLDASGRPVGNLDGGGNNRDFLGTGYAYTPPPNGGNPNAGTVPTDTQFRRGSVTQLFYLTNWYHDQLYGYGFDGPAGNFQGVDKVLAEAQDGAGTNNANFATPPDGTSGRMQMFVFDFPSPERDGSLDSVIVLHELTHGLSNRLIGDGDGMIWDVAGGMGEGWSDFVAMSLLNNTPTDNPNAQYPGGAYATYQLGGLTDNYLYAIRRFPYSTDNTVNPLTWADVDDVTYNEAGGIAASPLGFGFNGAMEVHNVGEIWANSLWEVRSRVIADPAGANGNVPTGNATMLQIVVDGLKMTPINPSFIDARDALIDADCAGNACANEASIWGGFADRGLGYGAVAPLAQTGILGIGGYTGIGESFSLPKLDLSSVAIDDSLGNNNGAIDPGEPIKITVTLLNPWRNAAKGVASATGVLSSSTVGVTIVDGNSTYPAIAAQGSAAGDTFTFTVPSSAACGQSLKFSLQTTSSLGVATVDFTLRVGNPTGDGAPVTYTRTVPGGLAIPDNDLNGVTDVLTVADDFEINDLDVRIDSLTHTFTGDVTVGVKAPNGYGTDLAYLRGIFIGDSDGDNFTNTRFDDVAANDLNLSGETDAPYTGSWQPAFNGAIWTLFGIPNLGPDPIGQLSRLNGTSTLGNWRMHLNDQANIDTGTLNSWSLIVTPQAFTCAAFVATPVVTGTKTVAGAFSVGGAITYTVTLTNNGVGAQPDNAGAEFTDVLPPSLTLVSATATSGSAVATVGTNTVTWDGTLAAFGGTVTITINATVNAGAAGTSVSNQGAISYDADANGTNEAAAVTDDPGTGTANDPTTFAVPGAALLSATKTVSSSFNIGSGVTYTIVITNSGSVAQADNPGNEFTDVLPAHVDLVSATATSGTAVATVGTNTVTWNGAIPASGSVTITINATLDLSTPAGELESNQGTLSFDGNNDGTNDQAGVTDDPTVAGAGNPTVFAAAASVLAIPTLSPLGLLLLALAVAFPALALVRRRRAAGR